jgi:hypothetical protein
LALIASNSACVIAPLSSSCFALSISALRRHLVRVGGWHPDIGEHHVRVFFVAGLAK